MKNENVIQIPIKIWFKIVFFLVIKKRLNKLKNKKGKSDKISSVIFNIWGCNDIKISIKNT